jgi:hypothetical protein
MLLLGSLPMLLYHIGRFFWDCMLTVRQAELHKEQLGYFSGIFWRVLDVSWQDMMLYFSYPIREASPCLNTNLFGLNRGIRFKKGIGVEDNDQRLASSRQSD